MNGNNGSRGGPDVEIIDVEEGMQDNVIVHAGMYKNTDPNVVEVAVYTGASPAPGDFHQAQSQGNEEYAKDFAPIPANARIQARATYQVGNHTYRFNHDAPRDAFSRRDGRNGATVYIENVDVQGEGPMTEVTVEVFAGEYENDGPESVEVALHIPPCDESEIVFYSASDPDDDSIYSTTISGATIAETFTRVRARARYVVGTEMHVVDFFHDMPRSAFARVVPTPSRSAALPAKEESARRGGRSRRA